MSSRTRLRQQCLAARSALSPAARRAASLRIGRRVRASPQYAAARHIALFWPMECEVEMNDLLGLALRDRKRCYLPVLRPGNTLWFVRYRAGATLYRNFYGIPEPRYRPRDALPAALLDLVLVPLLGFDRSGTRLGMGGGYYDRSFAFKLRDPGAKPRLLGVAFAAQELPFIKREEWDVPLGAVITEKETIVCPRKQ